MTAARIATLTAAITAFTSVMNNPRGQIVNRSTLLKEVDTDTADLLEQVADMDDLVLQFDGTDAGKRFIEAWKRARIIVDTGGGHSNGGTPPIPPATPGKYYQFPQKQNDLRKRRPFFYALKSQWNFTGLNFLGCSPHSFLRVRKLPFPQRVIVKIETKAKPPAPNAQDDLKMLPLPEVEKRLASPLDESGGFGT